VVIIFVVDTSVNTGKEAVPENTGSTVFRDIPIFQLKNHCQK